MQNKPVFLRQCGSFSMEASLLNDTFKLDH